MIWLTWRQYRRAALFTLIALGALAGVLVPTALAMHRAYDGLGLPQCAASLGSAQLVPQTTAAGCESLAGRFEQQYAPMNLIGILFVTVPLLVGLFFGAPLVSRELEHGTHRLVWTQGITRRRWILMRFGLIGGAALVLAVVYALGVAWWSGPLVAAGGGRFNVLSFDVQGVVPIGYTLFAIALGVCAGTFLGRTLSAMGATLAGFVVVRVVVAQAARPHFMAAASLTYPLRSALTTNPMANDWIFAQGVIGANGQVMVPNTHVNCPVGDVSGGSTGLGPVPVHGCSSLRVGKGASNWLLYQPGDRFWAFQGIETGIFLALAALLIALAVRRLGRVS
ncbi:MAG TPA: ABC transporter permease subunit [Actinocrinis sp.]